jgi:hypothetical protein
MVPMNRMVLVVAVAVLGTALMLAMRGRRAPAPSPAGEAGYHESPPEVRGFERRQARKDQVVQAVLAGRLTLLEAAALFRALDRGPPTFHWDSFRARWPGDSDDERHCHEVIDFMASAAIRDDPCKGKALRERLQAELAEHLRCGSLCLPDLITPGPP